MGLLSALMSAADSSKRYVKGLLSNPTDTINAWADRNVLDYTKPNVQEMAGNYMGAGVIPAGFLGKIVWHGSPHKFDKFDMSKIGTGEGAQAYGHGLYMAESPAVAKMYRDTVVPTQIIEKRAKNQIAEDAIEYSNGNLDEAISYLRDMLNQSWADKKRVSAAIKIIQSGNKPKIPQSNLYKVDIPDEAVARMLDWDKPLSEQSPEVRAMVEKTKTMLPHNAMDDIGGDLSLLYGAHNTGADFLGTMNSLRQNLGEEVLRNAGIPGIRYLDGGSRGAGNGTSNFVLFDDTLPRILERNGQPTGLLPWKPGEWR